MAYITLNEIKEILPEIMRDWIDKDDESWEWIFQEIEQKCHVGKKKKDKKPKKKDMQNAMEIAIMAHRNDINELTKKVDGLERDTTILSARISTLASSVEEIKWIAQTAKQRTEVDYSKYSGKSLVRSSYSKEAKKLNEELNNMTINDITQWCREQNNKEAKENEQTKITTEPVESCSSCKHYCGEYVIKGPCLDCINYNCWEAKDNE